MTRFFTSFVMLAISMSFYLNISYATGDRELAMNTDGMSQYEIIDMLSKKDAPIHEQVLAELRKQKGVITDPLSFLHPLHTAYNEEAVIPPQCYTKTEGKYNPCYVCHQSPVKGRENTMADGGLQLAYSFSDVGMTNHWENLFEDRAAAVKKISNDEIDEWISQDNYSRLAKRLEKAEYKGWIPDLEDLQRGADAFDKHGFAKDGSHWVAFNYKPFPSTFWPTNGSTDDVMIRLPEAFRTDDQGFYSRDIYLANLGIMEANLKGFASISSLPIDEKKIGVDLNEDGKQGEITQITKVDEYVGAAKERFINTYLYPKGTEFLHTVRYVAVNDDGDITVSTRMKEVRYMRKWRDLYKGSYARQYELEGFAKEQGQLPKFPFMGDHGLDNEFVWSVQGFIEGHDGELRTLTYEENLFCMGCHSSIGATIDKTFSFPRKIDGAEGWGYINLKGMQDAPNMGETAGEIETYFTRVGGGGEFRSNPEMFERWFNKDGTVNTTAVRNARDVYELITPSPERARELNKAYKVIVDKQDFIYGRDATAVPPDNVYDHIDNETAPTLGAEHYYQWDIRLDWGGHDGQKGSGSTAALK